MNFASKLIALVVGFGIAASASAGPVLSDVRFLSVDVIDIHQHPEIEWMVLRPDVPLLQLVVSFSSYVDLISLAKSAEYETGSDGRLCSSDKKHPTRIDVGYVHWGNFVVSPYVKDDVYDKLSKEHVSGSPFVYKAYFSIKRAEIKYGSYLSQSPAYDLLKNPADVCLDVRGGNMLGMSFESNEIVIPKESIAAALKRAGMNVANY